MAQFVQAQLEEMVPELQDLVEKQIISTERLGTIISKRRDFEYRLLQNNATPEVFLKYVNHEKALDALRQEAVTQQGWKLKSFSDSSIKTRIHFLFQRACVRFPYARDLWYEWLRYCLDSHHNAKFGRVVVKALAQHPHDVNLWLMAISRQLEAHNLKAARSIMMRGLRTCKRSPQLWAKLMEMEWAAVETVASQSFEETPTAEDCSEQAPLNIEPLQIVLQHGLTNQTRDEDKDFLVVAALMVLIELRCSGTPSRFKGLKGFSDYVAVQMCTLMDEQLVFMVWGWRCEIAAVATNDDKTLSATSRADVCVDTLCAIFERVTTMKKSAKRSNQSTESSPRRLLLVLFARFLIFLVTRNVILFQQSCKTHEELADLSGGITGRKRPRQNASESEPSFEDKILDNQEWETILEAWSPRALSLFKRMPVFAELCFLRERPSTSAETSSDPSQCDQIRQFVVTALNSRLSSGDLGVVHLAEAILTKLEEPQRFGSDSFVTSCFVVTLKALDFAVKSAHDDVRRKAQESRVRNLTKKQTSGYKQVKK